MSLEVQVFDNLKVKEENGQVLFDAESAAIGLGITDEKSGLTYVRWNRVNKYLFATSGENVKRGDFITEPQFYKLAIKANNETAEKFQDWVTSEVLPAIRKHGTYMTDKTIEDVLTNPDTIIRLATDLKNERQEKLALQQENNEMKPKALFADAVATSHTSVLVGELAKILKQNGVDTGATRLFSWLRDNGYLIRRKGTDYNMPTQKSMELGLFEIKETSIARSNGSVTVSKTPKVTGKGQQYFINKFLQAA